ARIARRLGVERGKLEIGWQRAIAFQLFERGSDACFDFGEEIHGNLLVCVPSTLPYGEREK
ncbi:MAG: hypothetical protein ABUL43_01630, partial [Hyphomicrobium sp.]